MKDSSLNSRDLRYIVYRNVFLLTNYIIFSVVILLFVFGEVRAGIFLGIISVLNIAAGLGQDIRAWLALQKLQLLTAPHVTRVNEGGTEESVPTEKIRKDDRVRLKIGDQVPCDSVVLDALNFEINEGLITGESNSITKKKGDRLLAGSIVTSGSSEIRIETVFHESRIARMTDGIKKYSVNMTPIQRSIDVIIRFSGYILLASLAFIIIRGVFLHEAMVDIILDVATLTSMIVPQGLVFAVTLFFAYGAANLFRKNVLLQEVNATEKLGRIKNLCMDKTGTITKNILSVKDVVMPEGMTREQALSLSATYIKGSGDSSQTIDAIGRFIGKEHVGSIVEALPFSSWRQYGGARVKDENGAMISIFAGPVQVFEPYIRSAEERKWLKNTIVAHSGKGERLLCFMKSDGSKALSDMAHTELSVIGIFVFYNELREGIRDTIDFFQNRGVNIRIISGDNPETASAVALAAGIKNSDKVITGDDIKSWREEDFEKKVGDYAIFSSIVPEQKKRIVEAFKKDGFTAMIGDGANDALAIKAADLGIAMFDGAPVVRQMASVVLTNNSFAALPGGVELADSIIRYIEMFASMFLNQAMIGFFFFLVVAISSHGYPLTPFNITLINYFTIGMPGLLISYWVIRPTGKVLPVDTRPFAERILPIAAPSAVMAALGVATAFLMAIRYSPEGGAGTLVSLSIIILGFFFFISIPKVYQGAITGLQRVQMLGLAIFEILVLSLVFQIPIIMDFFNIHSPNISYAALGLILLATLPFCLAQYGIARYFITARKA